MKAKFLALLCALCLCLSGCVHVLSADRIPSPDRSSVRKSLQLSGVTLGMTPEDFLDALDKLDIHLKYPRLSTDNELYNTADHSFYYAAEDYALYFTFTEDGGLCLISSTDFDVSTTGGLQVGDEPEEMEQIYGSGYLGEVNGMSVHQYCIDDDYLTIFYADGRLYGWILSSVEDILEHTDDPGVAIFLKP